MLIIFLLSAVVISSAWAQSTKRTILITGSTDGIGRISARDLIENANNFVILHGRNQSRCDNITKWMTQQVPGNTNYGCVTGEFLNQADVKRMAEDVKESYPDLNTLVLNAGIFPDRAEFSDEGLEKTFQINHFSHFVLAHLLKDTLIRNAPSRVVVVSSGAHRWVTARNDWSDYTSAAKPGEGASSQSSSRGGRPPGSLTLYGKSKLWNVMFADSLAEELEDDAVTVISLHPGHWQTKLSRWTGYPVENVRSVAFHTQDDSVEGVTGEYYNHCNPTCGVPGTRNPLITAANRKQLWDDSMKLAKERNLL